MSALAVLHLAREAGISFSIDGADLILDAEWEPDPNLLEDIKCHKVGIIALVRPRNNGWTAEDWQAFFEERAAIAEYDGGLSRAAAEVLAFECCVIEWSIQHSSLSSPDRCSACGEPDQQGHSVVPFGTGSRGHTWLHPECWEDWYEDRRTTAVAALATMDIENPAKLSNKFGKP